jgi:hypothetical protein
MKKMPQPREIQKPFCKKIKIREAIIPKKNQSLTKESMRY